MVIIAAAGPSDAEAIADLMEEVDRFYGATEIAPFEQRVTDISAALFGPTPASYVLLARQNHTVVGLASYSFLWPAVGVTRSLFLKELYVRQERKRQGIGMALMQEVCRVARDSGCSRVEWQTETTNGNAQAFYRALGARVFEGKVFYRLDDGAVAKVAGVQ